MGSFSSVLIFLLANHPFREFSTEGSLCEGGWERFLTRFCMESE